MPPRERLKLIKQLQLLNISIQEVWRDIAMPAQLFMVSIYTTSCLYAAIRLMDTVPWYLSPLFPLTLVITSVFAATAYTLFANILEQSVDLRASMKRAPMSEELRKAYLAVRPSRMDAGDLFSFKDETVLTWFDIVIDNTITILLL